MESALAATATGGETVSRPVLPNPTPALQDFGPYHAIGVLGEGGMGIVYLAEQRQPIRRRVALKVLKRGDDRPSFIARFESERQALAMMDHPNIAHVYDAGATADGRPYFVMEYVPGIPITDYCDRYLLGFRERLDLFQQVCQAVQHAHQKGIIHRDLKPSNVLVTLQDGKPVPKVIDFGVAKAVDQRLTEKTLFTETGMLIGTPEYMSPEQADLTGLDIDATTDIYSLGVLLYELLVGALPFDVKELRRAGYAEIQRIIREQEPPRPSTRLSGMGQSAAEIARRRRSDVRSLLRLLRGDLEWITMKALEKDPTRRYPSASDFAADIARHLASEPVLAGPPSLAYRMRKALRRNRGKIAACGVMALGLLIAVVPNALKRPAAPGIMAQHKIEIPGGSFWSQATDGRRMVYRDDATGELIYSEVGTKIRRVIYHARPDDLPSWMPSRDFSMVALQFGTRPNRPAFVALLQIDGKGYRELIRERRPYEFGHEVDDYSGMLGWSWDNRYLLMLQANQKPERVVAVSTASGGIEDLFGDNKRSVRQCAFSPDSRFVACYSEGVNSRLFVLPARGGTPRLIREEPSLRLFDWTADGRYLIVSSPRLQKPAMQLLPVNDGAPDGEPALIQAGDFVAAATTKAGTLIYKKAKTGAFWPVYTASLDERGRPGGWRRLELPLNNDTVPPNPSWSPDGAQIVYTAQDAGATSGNYLVRIREIATGRDREIYRTGEMTKCVWASRHATVFCSSWATDTDILAISPDTGQVRRLGSFPATPAFLYGASGDDRALFVGKLGKEKSSVRWEIATHRETLLDNSPADSDFLSWISPDEHWLVRADRHQIRSRPVHSEDWKPLISSRFEYPQYAFTPDGKWILYHDMDTAGGDGLFRVPTAGGVAVRLGDFPFASAGGTIVLSPDGRNVIASAFDYAHASEVFALDNFIPRR
jgi:serine/threonine protein kinase/Tol biopolymer transport system component